MFLSKHSLVATRRFHQRESQQVKLFSRAPSTVCVPAESSQRESSQERARSTLKAQHAAERSDQCTTRRWKYTLKPRCRTSLWRAFKYDRRSTTDESAHGQAQGRRASRQFVYRSAGKVRLRPRSYEKKLEKIMAPEIQRSAAARTNGDRRGAPCSEFFMLRLVLWFARRGRCG